VAEDGDGGDRSILCRAGRPPGHGHGHGQATGASGKSEAETRAFSTNTAGLVALRDWLVAEGVTRAGMESTGMYWKPVLHLLEDRIREV
jgi:transposase